MTKEEEKRQKPSQQAHASFAVSYSHSLGFANTIWCQQMFR